MKPCSGLLFLFGAALIAAVLAQSGAVYVKHTLTTAYVWQQVLHCVEHKTSQAFSVPNPQKSFMVGSFPLNDANSLLQAMLV